MPASSHQKESPYILEGLVKSIIRYFLPKEQRPRNGGCSFTEAEARTQLKAYCHAIGDASPPSSPRFCFDGYPSTFRNHDGLNLTSARLGTELLHCPVMGEKCNKAMLRGERLRKPGAMRIVFARGHLEKIDIVFHDKTRATKKGMRHWAFSIAPRKKELAVVKWSFDDPTTE